MIYNVGCFQYYEYPVFICTKNHVFRFFFSDHELSVHTYAVEDFCNMRKEDIMRYSSDPSDFDYILPEGYKPNAQICGVFPVKGCGVTSNLNGLALQFSNGSKLCMQSSDLVLGAMDSWVE